MNREGERADSTTLKKVELPSEASAVSVRWFDAPRANETLSGRGTRVSKKPMVLKYSMRSLKTEEGSKVYSVILLEYCNTFGFVRTPCP